MKQPRIEAATSRPRARQPDDAELTPADREATVHAMITAVLLGHLICMVVYSPYWYS